MGILSKLKFWKKDDEFDFDELAENEFETPKQEDLDLDRDLSLDNQSGGLDEKSFFDEQSSPSKRVSRQPLEESSFQRPLQSTAIPIAGTRDRDLELIISKLDTLKAILNSMDQRIANLERVAGAEKKPRLW